MSVTIGIDFGTSFCSASWINPNTGKPEAARFRDSSSEKLPSIIAFNNAGKPLVGTGPATQLEDIAADTSLSYAERETILSSFYTSIKTRMRQGQKWIRPKATYSNDDMISFILKKVKEEVESSCPLGGMIGNVVLTHPVQFEEWKKDTLKHAAALAGFKKVKLLEEPIAAALYTIKAGIVPKSCKGVLVYDFGAGTFDVSYIQVEADGELHIPVLPQGDSRCGGDDIDRALYEDWDKYVKSTKSRTILQDPNEMDIAFLYRCRRKKEQMSKGVITDIISEYIPNSGNVKRAFSKSDFDRIVNPIVAKTIDKTKLVVEEVKRKGLPLTHAVLIGGSSNLPQVQTQIKQLLGNSVTIITTGNNDIAVAVGALYSLNITIPKPNDTPKPPTPPKECYCIYCGHKILTSHKVCMYCGKPNFSYKP